MTTSLPLSSSSDTFAIVSAQAQTSSGPLLTQSWGNHTLLHTQAGSSGQSLTQPQMSSIQSHSGLSVAQTQSTLSVAQATDHRLPASGGWLPVQSESHPGFSVAQTPSTLLAAQTPSNASIQAMQLQADDGQLPMQSQSRPGLSVSQTPSTLMVIQAPSDSGTLATQIPVDDGQLLMQYQSLPGLSVAKTPSTLPVTQAPSDYSIIAAQATQIPTSVSPLSSKEHDVPSHMSPIPEFGQASFIRTSGRSERHPKKVLLLYCKDPALNHCLQLDPTHWRSEEQYCDEVKCLADTLTLFSAKNGEDGQCCPVFTCVYDVYVNTVVNNWLMWTDTQLKEADLVLLACSPTLYSSFQSSLSTVSMQKACCDIRSLVNTMTKKPFCPIFLNMPIQPDWIPVQLEHSDRFQLNVSGFHEAVGDTDGLDEEAFIQRANHCFESDSRFSGLLSLLKALRDEPTQAPEPLNIPTFLSSLHLGFSSKRRTAIVDECLTGNKRQKLESPSLLGKRSLDSKCDGVPSKLRHSEYLQEYVTHSFLPAKGLSLLKKTVKKSYSQQQLGTLAAGPVMDPVEFINLALVKKQRLTAKQIESDAFLRHTLHGNIDDIPFTKERLKIENIFLQQQGGKKNRVKRMHKILVEGAPGIGKTMLAQYLCQEWAEGRMLKEFDLVLLVPLRRFFAECATSLGIQDLVRIYLSSTELAMHASDELEDSGGEKTLIILEGWDELPSELRKDVTFFHDLLIGHKLPQASVLVTSRPTVAGDLYRLVNRRIEVLGFQEEQIDEYIKVHISEKVDYMREHFKRYPVIKSFAHIPLTLAIMCTIVETNGVLPPTETLLYEEYMYQQLLCNKKRLPGSNEAALEMMSKDEFFELASYIMQPLAKLALDGFKKKKFVFTARDLCSVGIDSSQPSVGLGLLNSIPSYREKQPLASGESPEVLYQFRHLSIQEYLAAKRITQLKLDEQKQLLTDHRSTRQFYNIWKFLAGISQLQNDHFHNAIVETTDKADRKDMLLLYHCLYESQSPQSCQKASSKLRRYVDLSNCQLKVTDCLCIAYVVSKAGGRWSIDLRNCGIGAEGLGMFWTVLKDETNTEEVVIASLDLSLNNLDKNAAKILAGLLRSQVHIVELIIGSNYSLKDGGIKEICAALHSNKLLRKLHFAKCNMGENHLEHICAMLENNSSLQELYLDFASLGSDLARLGEVLVDNTSLKELSLSFTDMSQRGLRRLANNLADNNSLEVVRIGWNKLGPDACGEIVKIVKNCKKLKLLDVTKNPIGDDGFIQIVNCLSENPTPSLKKLGIYGCEIGLRGVEKFASYLKETKVLEGFHLGGNPIQNKGARCLIDAIKENQSLKEVLIDGTGISSDMEQELLALHGSREGLEVMLEPNASAKKWREKELEAFQ